MYIYNNLKFKMVYYTETNFTLYIFNFLSDALQKFDLQNSIKL